ncbi:MAG: hypothetical protein SWH68_07655 [Thermodesulfobacteriota bacterium]|nr:hypothetical protein [Thermodesulfobacteriota bacterium]
MSRPLFFVRIVIIGCCCMAAAQVGYGKERTGSIRVSDEVYVESVSVKGAGKDRSVLNDGIHSYNLLRMHAHGNTDDLRYRFNLGVQMTDNEKKDPKEVSLVNLEGNLASEKHELTAGDVFGSFSRYSLGTSLKGVSYGYGGRDADHRVDVIYGIAYPRWDSFWASETEALEREIYGLNYGARITPEMKLDFSWVRSSDSDPIFDDFELYDVDLYTAALNYKPIAGLTVTSEYSYSDNAAGPDAAPQVEKTDGAFMLKAVGNQNPSRVSLEYERVGTDYITRSGSATPDREKFKANWRYRYSRKAHAIMGFLWFRDNLDHQKSGTTHTYRPSLGFSFKQLMDRRYGVLDLTWKLNNINTDTADTTDHYFDVMYRDRYGVIDNTTTVGYALYETGDDQRDQEEVSVNTTFSGRITLDAVILKPSLHAGTTDTDDELSNNDNRLYQTALGLGLEIPRARITSLLKVGRQDTNRDGGDDLDRNFATFNVYWRVPDLASFANALFYIKTLYNDYNYTTQTNNFRENSVILGLRATF